MKTVSALAPGFRSVAVVALSVVLAACGTLYRRPATAQDRSKPHAQPSDVPGYVVSPYSGKYVRVENVPPQVLIHDPTSGREFFYAGDHTAASCRGKAVTVSSHSQRGNRDAFRHAYYGRMADARAAVAEGQGTRADIESGAASARRDRDTANLVGGVLLEMLINGGGGGGATCQMCGRGAGSGGDPGSDGLCVNCRGTVMGR
jgi:hypothetical protein